MDKKVDRLSIRVTPEFSKKLDDLSELWGINKTSVITRLVYAEWQRSTTMGQKELKELAKKFNGLTIDLEKLGKQLDG